MLIKDPWPRPIEFPRKETVHSRSTRWRWCTEIHPNITASGTNRENHPFMTAGVYFKISFPFCDIAYFHMLPSDRATFPPRWKQGNLHLLSLPSGDNRALSSLMDVYVSHRYISYKLKLDVHSQYHCFHLAVITTCSGCVSLVTVRNISLRLYHSLWRPCDLWPFLVFAYFAYDESQRVL